MLLLVLQLLGAVAACSRVPGEQSTKQVLPSDGERSYNIVLVSLDTLRADHLSLYGYERLTSPFMESLAKDSVVFDLAISHSSHTVPAHRALFQSQIVSQLSGSAPNLPKILQSVGYRTSAFVGGAKVSPQFGFDESFDDFVEHFGGFSTASRRVGEWLALQQDRPFFLFVHTYDVHLPYNPPAPFDESFLPDHESWVTGPESRRAVQQLSQLDLPADQRVVPNDDDLAKLVALYDGGILYADSQVQRLVDNLKQLGHWQDTLFIVLSDHGEEFWDHGGLAHGLTLYQEMIHVPLIIHFPEERFAGLRVSEPIALIDILPTILEVIGVEKDAQHQGSSLVPLLRGEEAGRPPIISQISGLSAVTRYPWKLIAADTGSTLLFNLEKDPGEELDVADQHPDVVAALAAEMQETLLRRPQYEMEGVNPGDIDDKELRRQLEALGYLGDQ